jgi:hypothetical protein
MHPKGPTSNTAPTQGGPPLKGDPLMVVSHSRGNFYVGVRTHYKGAPTQGGPALKEDPLKGAPTQRGLYSMGPPLKGPPHNALILVWEIY